MAKQKPRKKRESKTSMCVRSTFKMTKFNIYTISIVDGERDLVFKEEYTHPTVINMETANKIAKEKYPDETVAVFDLTTPKYQVKIHRLDLMKYGEVTLIEE